MKETSINQKNSHAIHDRKNTQPDHSPSPLSTIPLKPSTNIPEFHLPPKISPNLSQFPFHDPSTQPQCSRPPFIPSPLISSHPTPSSTTTRQSLIPIPKSYLVPKELPQSRDSNLIQQHLPPGAAEAPRRRYESAEGCKSEREASRTGENLSAGEEYLRHHREYCTFKVLLGNHTNFRQARHSR
ncbi:hypothetical protein N7G274_004377 [Stereocaulon virgatum]|uniref:Uncharacterized protein n=1 Tax=Stereocaulon virgatum TaxID=373712 RepID=A0ABR4AC22_9LECA